MDLSAIPIVDHHAHSLLKPEATASAAGFRQWFTELTDPEIHARHVEHSLFFRTGLRWLAEILGCEPTLEAYLAARANSPTRPGPGGYLRRPISAFCCATTATRAQTATPTPSCRRCCPAGWSRCCGWKCWPRS